MERTDEDRDRAAAPAAPPASSRPMSRRAAIARIGAAAGGAAALALFEGCANPFSRLYSPRFGSRLNVGRKGDFPPAGPKDFELDHAGVFYRQEARAYIVHLSAGTELLLSGSALERALGERDVLQDADGSHWLALYQACTHMGAKVAFPACGHFRCPSHGASYNVDGEYLDGPAPRSMDRFPIFFDGDDAIVDTGRINQSVLRPEPGTRLLAVPGSPCIP